MVSFAGWPQLCVGCDRPPSRCATAPAVAWRVSGVEFDDGWLYVEELWVGDNAPPDAIPIVIIVAFDCDIVAVDGEILRVIAERQALREGKSGC
jgi:hypothetical protein